MTWLTVWLHTLIGSHRWPHIVEPDHDLLAAQSTHKDQRVHLEILERELETIHPKRNRAT